MSESTNKASDPKIVYDYPPPVSKLLTMGDVRKIRGWSNYLDLGLTLDHVPDLIRMALDEELHWAMSDALEVWAPIHAWRALAQLRAEAAVEPLIELLSRIDEHDDDWVNEELPEVFGHIGQASIEPVARFLADADQGLWSRVAAASSFAEIGKRRPEHRAQCVATLTQQLAQYPDQDHTLNGFIISYLTDLKAVESTSMMEQAFAAGCVDISIQGDWEDTQIWLGLLQRRLTPKPNYRPFLDQTFSPSFGESRQPDRPRQQKTPRRTEESKTKAKIKAELEAARKAKAKAKAKRKQRKKARRKQRKRK